jgi:hypothetical protein
MDRKINKNNFLTLINFNMNPIKLILAGIFVLTLSSCGGNDQELLKKTEELKKNTDELKAIAMQFKFNQESVNGAVNRLSSSLNTVNNAAANVEDKISRNQVVINKNVESLSNQQVKLENQLKVFNESLSMQLKEFNDKIASLEALYIKEGVVQLTGEDGKINVEKFPALASTEVEFIEELKSDEHNFGRTDLDGRVQSNGKWTINGKSYQLFDFMTFHVDMNAAKITDGEASFYPTMVTFKNTHGEVVTTNSVEGYLINSEDKQKVKWEIRQLENGKKQAFIPKGSKYKLVLSKPLNLAIRK